MLQRCMCLAILQSLSFCPPPRFCIIIIVPVAILPKQTLSDIRPGIQRSGPPRCFIAQPIRAIVRANRSEAGLLDTPRAQHRRRAFQDTVSAAHHGNCLLPTLYVARRLRSSLLPAHCRIQITLRRCAISSISKDPEYSSVVLVRLLSDSNLTCATLAGVSIQMLPIAMPSLHTRVWQKVAKHGRATP